MHNHQLVTPGMDYKVTVTSPSGAREIRFDVPEGHTLYLNDSPYTNTATYNFPSGTTELNYYLMANDGSSALRPGFAIDPQIQDVIWAIGLGRTRNGRPVGSLTLRQADITGQAFSLDRFVLAAGAGEAAQQLEFYSDTQVRGSSSPYNYYRRFILSVGNCWLWLDDRVSGQPQSYVEIKVYRPDAVPEWVSGSSTYQFKVGGSVVSPLATYAVESSGSSHDTVKFTKNKGVSGQEIAWTLNKSNPGGATTWLLTKGTGTDAQAVRSVSTTASGVTTEVVTIENGSSSVFQRYLRTYRTFNWNQPELETETVDPTGYGGSAPANLTTTYKYGETAGPAYGKLVSVQRPDGNYVKYEYSSAADSYGKLEKVYTPWQDIASTADNATDSTTAPSTPNAQVVTYTYAPVHGYLKDALASVTTKVPNGSGGSVEVGKTEYTPDFTSTTFNPGSGAKKVRKETIKAYSSASSHLDTVRLSYHPDETAGDLANRLISQTGPDGSKVSVLFYQGKFTNNGDSNSTLFQTSSTSSENTQWGEYRFSGFSTAVSGTQPVSQWNGKTIDTVHMVPNRSTVELTVLVEGQVTNTVRYLFTGATGGVPALDFVGATARTFNPLTGVEEETDHRGGLATRTYTHGRLTQDVANDGRQVNYVHNSLGWVTRQELTGIAAGSGYAAQAPVYTHYTYDSAGRLLTEKISASATAPASTDPTLTRTYDSAGRLKTSTDAQGIVTTYDYSSNGRTVTATWDSAPNTKTRITESRIDGSIKSVTGTAVVAEHYAFTVNTDGTVTRTVRALSDSTSAPRYASSTVDWLGRVIREESPGPQGVVKTVRHYNDQGQLWKSQTLNASDQRLAADTLIEYNDWEEPFRSGLDLNPNSNQLDLAIDRVVLTESSTEKDGNGAWWLVTQTKIHNREDASASTALLTGTRKVRLNKFSGGTQSELRSYDLNNIVTSEIVTLDRTNRLVTTTLTPPDSSATAVSITRNGLLVSSKTSQNLTTTYAYDGLRRLVQTVDPRIGATVTEYFGGSEAAGKRFQVRSVQDPSGATTLYSYDALGRVDSVRTPTVSGQPDKYTYFEYTPQRGELRREWGNAANPVEYEYNDYGEQTKMRTYQDGTWTGSSWGGASATANLTEWVYFEATGLLDRKIDAEGRDVRYTYNALGQLQTREWQRPTVSGGSTRLKTTYAYFGETGGEPQTNELKSVDHNNTSGSDPDLAYTYDRLGRIKTVTDVNGQRSFTYSPTELFQEKETLPAFYGNRILTGKYDDGSVTPAHEGRSIGFSLGVSGNLTSDFDIGFGYDTYARPDKFTVGGATFTYSYQANSNLIAGLADSASSLTQTRTWLTNRNLLDKIETKYGTANKATYDYAHDEMGRRTNVVQTGELFARYQTGALVTKWEYSDRSELKSAVTYFGSTPGSVTDSDRVAGRGFDYEYDHAGNRTKATVRGTGTGDVSLIDLTGTGSINHLNQIKKRAVSGKASVSGVAPAAATVQVAVDGGSAQSVTRQGEYYFKNVDVANGSGPAYAAIAVTSSLSQNPVNKGWFVPKATGQTTEEEWKYDEDGNLTQDDRWTYTWDAENRLIGMETRLGQFPSTAQVAEGRKLTFTYDYLGRRVDKRVEKRNTTNNGWEAHTRTRFIYNGWNLVAEYSVSSTDVLTLTRSYTWGLDLSGTQSGAGGVGGLLAIHDAATSTSYGTAYDGNGNLTALIKRTGSGDANGTVAAAYEYTGFGETIRASGTYAATNPFRFSTKYTDDETGLVYYGMRYYDPANGRFLGRDPSGEQGGRNLYAFCGNNAVGRTDYLGLWWNWADIGNFLGGWVASSLQELGEVLSGLIGYSWNDHDLGEIVRMAPFDVIANRDDPDEPEEVVAVDTSWHGDAFQSDSTAGLDATNEETGEVGGGGFDSPSAPVSEVTTVTNDQTQLANSTVAPPTSTPNTTPQPPAVQVVTPTTPATAQVTTTPDQPTDSVVAAETSDSGGLTILPSAADQSYAREVAMMDGHRGEMPFFGPDFGPQPGWIESIEGGNPGMQDMTLDLAGLLPFGMFGRTAGTTTVRGFRAVSTAELDDIVAYGLRPHPQGRSMQDKWFSETAAGAEKFTQTFPDLKHIVEVDVPKSVYDQAFRHPNIDGTGPGFAVPAELLKQIKVK